jgi:hypothetical protein
VRSLGLDPPALSCGLTAILEACPFDRGLSFGPMTPHFFQPSLKSQVRGSTTKGGSPSVPEEPAAEQ